MLAIIRRYALLSSLTIVFYFSFSHSAQAFWWADKFRCIDKTANASSSVVWRSHWTHLWGRWCKPSQNVPPSANAGENQHANNC